MRADEDVKQMLAFQAGNLGAFQALFAKYQKKIIQFCHRFCGDQAMAEELAQEVFLNIYRGAAGYRPKARFSTWLFQIAVNVCLNEMRKEKYRHRIDSMDASPETESGKPRIKELCDPAPDQNELLEQQEREMMIQKALMGLPEKQRLALSLRVLNGFSYQEIGTQIRCSESAVKTLIHRGRQHLKELLENLYAGGDKS